MAGIQSDRAGAFAMSASAGPVSAASMAFSALSIQSRSSGDSLIAEEIVHPITRRRMWKVSESSIAAFRARFLNLTMIEQEFGLQRNVSRSILNGAAVRPYLAGKGNVGTLYLRIEVEEALRAAGLRNG